MNQRQRVLPFLIVAVAAALFLPQGRLRSQPPAAPAEPPVPGATQPPAPAGGAETAVVPPPLPAGPAPDLNLVFTAQVTGWIEPCG